MVAAKKLAQTLYLEVLAAGGHFRKRTKDRIHNRPNRDPAKYVYELVRPLGSKSILREGRHMVEDMLAKGWLAHDAIDTDHIILTQAGREILDGSNATAPRE
jgi:hypothetical protein